LHSFPYEKPKDKNIDYALKDLLKYRNERNQRFEASVLQNIAFLASARHEVNIFASEVKTRK